MNFKKKYEKIYFDDKSLERTNDAWQRIKREPETFYLITRSHKTELKDYIKRQSIHTRSTLRLERLNTVFCGRIEGIKKAYEFLPIRDDVICYDVVKAMSEFKARVQSLIAMKAIEKMMREAK